MRAISKGRAFSAAICIGWLTSSSASMISQSKPGTSPALKIVVIAGEDAVNIIQQKTAVAPIIEVRDRNDQPVAGAVVNFAIRGGRATFGGARTLAVTTDIAGRAVATGLTPTASGAVQIGASAAFQGQTAAITIAQTNVLTAAQAAAVSSAGSSGTASGTSAGAGSGGSSGGATAGAGAGAGGGGGLSATTIGIIGGAAAGGAVVATKALGGPGGTPYTGQYSGDIVVTGPAPFCGFRAAITGTLVLHIEDPSAQSLTGTAEINESNATIYNPACQLANLAPFQETIKPPVSGAPTNIAFNYTRDNSFTSQNGTTGIRTKTLSFAGAFNGSEIVGTLVNTEANRSTGGPNITASGTTSFQVTLRP